MFEECKFSNKGFSLIEGVISIAIFSIIFLSLISLFSVIFNSVRNNKAESSANMIALEQLEIIRGMSFDNVRTDTGWTPPGELASEKNINRAGYNFTVKIDVGWEDDAFDGLSPADTFPFDYKNVRVRVVWKNPITNSESTLAMNTNVVPEGIEGLSLGKGGILVKVFDASGTVISGATVDIDSVSESYSITGLTDLNGNLWIPDLEPSDDYHIVASKTGYNSDQTYAINDDDTSEDYNPIPTKPDALVISEEITEIGLAIDLLGGLNLQTVNYNNPQNWLASDDIGTEFQREASIYIDGSDNLFIAWLDGRSGTDRIYAQKYSYNSVAGLYEKQWNDDIEITNGLDKTLPEVKAYLDKFYVSYATQETGNMRVMFEKFNSSDGSLVWGPEVVSGSSNQINSDLVIDSMENVYIVWTDDINGNWDIYVKKFDSSGAVVWGTDLKISSDLISLNQLDPKIVVDDEDNFYVVWEEVVTGDSDIYWAKFDSNGGVLFAETKVNSDSSSLDQYEPDIVFDGTDYFYISWSDERNSQPDIYAQKFDKSGNVMWASSDIKINDDTLPDAWRTKSAVAYSGNILYFSWEDDRNGDADIYSTKFDSAGTKLWTYDLIMNSVATGSQEAPDVVADSLGYGITAWEDDRSGEYFLYFSRYKDLGFYIRASNPITVTGAKLKGTYFDGVDFLPIYKYLEEFTSDVSGFINISEIEWDNYSFSTDEFHTIISTDQPEPLVVAPGATENAVINIEP
ncbi:MAG: carboxypeptidase regulatory-like domain-containing protein [Candidatus Pacebacteria bacterium]|nr:carboxypeptidase regulatory-like domain-containing protein [Candidatus Paceibacterota bacterium]